MGKPDFDPREVLERYVALLREPGTTAVRSVTELAHPKESIRNVLQHCIRTETDPGAREFLHDAYISLSNFQEIGEVAAEGSKMFDKQARQITHVAGPLRSLLDRVTSERAVLAQELKSLAGAG
jgi:hypothetical protein